MWTAVADLKRKRYYYHTQTSRTVRMVVLDRQPKNVLSVQDLPAEELILDVSNKFIPAGKTR